MVARAPWRSSTGGLAAGSDIHFSAVSGQDRFLRTVP
jgi:hypothetical protein